MGDLLEWLFSHGLFALFALATAGMNIPLPVHSVLSYAGVMASNGKLGLLPALISASAGSCVGVTISYILGSTVGTPLLRRHAEFLRCPPAKVERLRQWLLHGGRWALTFGFFMPGVRNMTGLAAGALKLKFALFAPFAYAGGVLWAVTWVLVGYWLGRQYISQSTMHLVLLIAFVVSITGTTTCILLRKVRNVWRSRK